MANLKKDMVGEEGIKMVQRGQQVYPTACGWITIQCNLVHLVLGGWKGGGLTLTSHRGSFPLHRRSAGSRSA